MLILILINNYLGVGQMNKMGKLALSVVFAGSVLFAGGNASEAANNKSSDDGILINKATNQLVLYQDGKRIVTYSVATGKDEKSNKSPEGTFKIVNKVKERKWNKENIPGGDPRNPLGARWLGLEVVGAKGIKDSWGAKTGNSYGIHGHAKGAEWSIGKKVTGGCFRLTNAAVIDIFNKVLKGTKVKVYNNKNQSFDQVARSMGILKASKAAAKPAAKTSQVKAKVVKWSGSKVTIKYGSKQMTLSTSNKWYQNNLKKNKIYVFFYQGSKITKVNA